MRKFLRSQEAFTLIELMITVAIVAILASIAMPRYGVFQAKAKTVEATNNLATIRTLQETYRAEYDAYRACAATPPTVPKSTPLPWAGPGVADFKTLGFQPDGDVRYQYVVSVTGLYYSATATGDVDGDGEQAQYVLTNLVPKPILATPGVY